MTLYRKFTDWLKQRQDKLAGGQQLHRQLVILSIDEVQLYITTIAKDYPSALFITPKPISVQDGIEDVRHARLNVVAPERYRSLLGTQTQCLIFDARKGVNLDALIATSGLVKSSGLLFLILPEHYNNTERYKNQGIVYSYAVSSNTNEQKSLFLSLLISRLKASQVLWIDKNFDKQQVYYCGENFTSYTVDRLLQDQEGNNNTQKFALSEQQISIITQVFKNTRRPNIHVILGDRGRGKSTTLAAIYLRAKNHKAVFVTAPTKSQLRIFEDHISTSAQNQTISYPFFPSDQILAALAELTVDDLDKAILLIDEVASIAPALLKKMVNKCGTTIIAGTTQGYEGSGQGFVHRVIPFLKSVYACNVHELSIAFRWYENDPVEAFFMSLLGLNGNTDNNVLKTKSDLPEVTFEGHSLCFDIKVVDREEFARNPFLFQSVVTLLREAHYQTTPNDVVRLLDAPDHILIIATHRKNEVEQLCGLTVLIKEGGKLLAPLSADIALGKRRVQGHLTPQALSLHLLQANICEKTCLRINRIAVKDDCRLKGLGSKMVTFCTDYARYHNHTYISTSYGFTEPLLRFWRSNSFEFVKLGSRTDTSSGTVSALMLKNLSLPNWPKLQQELNNKLNLDLDFLNDIYSQKSVLSLKKCLQHTSIIHNIETITHCNNKSRMLSHFIEGHVSLDKVASIVWSLINYDTNNQKNDLNKLVEPFISYHAKGLHKEHKNRLQENIRESIKTHSYPNIIEGYEHKIPT